MHVCIGRLHVQMCTLVTCLVCNTHDINHNRSDLVKFVLLYTLTDRQGYDCTSLITARVVQLTKKCNHFGESHK